MAFCTDDLEWECDAALWAPSINTSRASYFMMLSFTVIVLTVMLLFLVRGWRVMNLYLVSKVDVFHLAKWGPWVLGFGSM